MYQTFMNAYTLVDAQTRRKLDEMLKTWKEPVPGSLDTRPVFPPEITRNIENALIKARTAAIQQQQSRGQPDVLNRGRASATPTGWTNSSTPPQGIPRPPSNQPFLQPGLGYNTTVGGPPYPLPFTINQVISQTPHGHHSDMDSASLNRALEGLIGAARNDFANSPFDPTYQQRLKALLDLQRILQQQQLTPDQLKLVRDQVSALAASQPTPSAQTTASNFRTAPAPESVSTPPIQTTSQPLQQLLNPGTLAELIKATAVRQQPTPPPQISTTLTSNPQGIPASHTQPSVAENPLIAALRARGLLPPASAPPTLASSGGTPPTGTSLPFIIPGQINPTPPASTPQVPMPSNAPSAVPMSTASMKM